MQTCPRLPLSLAELQGGPHPQPPRPWLNLCGAACTRLSSIARTPVEFKAGQTVAADGVEALNRYRSRALLRGAGQPRIAPAQIVYGGDEPRTRSGVDVTPWRGWPRRALGLLEASV